MKKKNEKKNEIEDEDFYGYLEQNNNSNKVPTVLKEILISENIQNEEFFKSKKIRKSSHDGFRCKK
jgi:hypothetical protein